MFTILRRALKTTVESVIEGRKKYKHDLAHIPRLNKLSTLLLLISIVAVIVYKNMPAIEKVLGLDPSQIRDYGEPVDSHQDAIQRDSERINR
jgi:hypothetical protein